MTQTEWEYVFNTRSTSSGIRYAKAQVNNVNGVILIPDDWSSSTYSLNNTNNGGADFSSNIMTALQWSTLEQAGAVFMPAAGIRYETMCSEVGSGGEYWSASCFDGYQYSRFAYTLGFDSNVQPFANFLFRDSGSSVRLVRNAE